jgi:demethylmenaquinone methyltransferase/2-methoxy-6-polyprenyl-1,4-benzoquinol methylase
MGIDGRWRRQMIAALHLGSAPARVLDVATGTADVAIALARRHPGVSVVGVDPSPKMLEVGRGKLARQALAGRVELQLGDAQELGFADRSFDAATIAFGIRNVPDRGRGLREMARVVKPGGRIAVLELSEPGGGVFGRLAGFHVHHVVPRLGALLSGDREYRYLQASISGFPPAGEFARLMENSGLEVLEVRALTFGVCHLYVATPRGGAS